MSHLSPEELVDIAEGARPGSAHLATCERCRRQLAEVRSVMAVVAEVDVPEPSPLFWDYFSARVGEAVAAEAAAPRAGWFAGSAFASATADKWFASSRLLLPVAAAVAALALVVGASLARRAPVAPAASEAQAIVDATAPSEPRPLLVDTDSDPLFTFVADLTTDMDMDTAVAAGLVSDDSADHAVAHLSEGELRALAGLLQAEIAHGQAS